MNTQGLTRSQSASTSKSMNMVESRLSVSQVQHEMFSDGFGAMISLDGDEKLDPEVECLAAEFAQITKGKIDSAFSPMELNLKGRTGEVSFTIGSMSQVVHGMKRVMKLSNNLYMRLSKVQILYCPLFHRSKNENDTIDFFLVDERMKGSEENKEIAKITARINEMSMIEMKMSFFVPRKDIGKIKVKTKLSCEPVTSGSFATMLVAFFVHSSNFAGSYTTQDSRIIYINPIDAPEDIKKGSVIRNIGKQLEKSSKTRNLKLTKSEDLEKERQCALRGNLAVQNGNQVMKLEEYKKSQILEEQKEKESEYLRAWAAGKVISKKRFALDMRIKNHFVHLEGHVGDTLIHGKMVTLIKKLTTFIGNKIIDLSDVYVGNNVDPNLLSYNKLKSEGIIDSMDDVGNHIILKKDEEEVFVVDNSGDDEMWILSRDSDGMVYLF